MRERFARRAAGIRNNAPTPAAAHIGRIHHNAPAPSPDPAVGSKSTGSEAWVRINAWDTDLTLADWQAAAIGSVTAPFTFSDYEYLDQIEVQ